MIDDKIFKRKLLEDIKGSEWVFSLPDEEEVPGCPKHAEEDGFHRECADCQYQLAIMISDVGRLGLSTARGYEPRKQAIPQVILDAVQHGQEVDTFLPADRPKDDYLTRCVIVDGILRCCIVRLDA